ncbi:uncharacterized protein [Triticum aestivum]|uniref:uncharacterized protein n=1 Tax=Triticum aestivum TaxID=4565 RepID=UPI001D0351FF|nr:uncharacterized protein LOC123065392 [Triticum aestivum]XP_044447094.1 uncharacterized protein LOC123177384 [Triticum aestivum]XP_044447095.1 uncharacterized protein LOC123177385 [Triticum aestivum]
MYVHASRGASGDDGADMPAVVRADVWARANIPSVKQEDVDVVVHSVEPIDHVHLDGLLGNLQSFAVEMEVASRALALNVSVGFVHQVIDISDDESNDEVGYGRMV